MDINTAYEMWSLQAKEDNDLVSELESMKGNEKEIHERFYTEGTESK